MSAVTSAADAPVFAAPKRKVNLSGLRLRKSVDAEPQRNPFSWLDASELRGATVRWASCRSRLEVASCDTLRKLIRRALKSEIGFIGHSDFEEADAAEAIFADVLGLREGNPYFSDADSGAMPAAVGRLCEAELLTPEQEVLLFRRMNFLRHQAARVRSRLSPDSPSAEDLQTLERLLISADWHRDRIVEANLRLVVSIVKKFVNESNQFEDLLSDGIVAMMRAVEKFDIGRGFRFSTYATQVVRRNAYREVVQKRDERSRMSLGIEELGLDISDENRQSPISEKRWHALRSRLQVMLDQLDHREKLIVRARFSLGSHRRVHTLQSLAGRLGVSKERVRQLEHRALEKLRRMAAEAELRELDI